MSTKNEIKEAFKQLSKVYPNFFDLMMQDDFNLSEIIGFNVKLEQSFGGEGEGDTYFSVYSFTKNGETIYIKFNGWYASYHGSEFSDWYFVKPETKTITVFEAD